MLTVVIPVLNGVDHVDRCIQSVQAPGVEVIVVDDGSTDGTADHVEVRWPDVRVLRQSNRGPSAARNAGVRASSGDWIAFIDADDRALPGWAAVLSSGGGEDGVVTLAARVFIGDSGHVNEPSWVPPARDGIAVNFLPGTFAVRRDIFESIGGYDEDLHFAENTELGMRLRDECDRRGLAFKPVGQVLLEQFRPADVEGRSRAYAGRRAAAARRLLRVHAERFRHDPAARRTHWRIIAVAERQQGHRARCVAAAMRSFVRPLALRSGPSDERSNMATEGLDAESTDSAGRCSSAQFVASPRIVEQSVHLICHRLPVTG